MPRYAELPNGTRLEFPDETPDAVMDKVVKGHITGAQQPTQQEPSMLEKAGGFGRDVLAGAVKGASNIGATALYPLDAMGVTGMTNEERRAKVDQFMKEHGADTESTAYGAGKLGAEIAGTAGAGGLLARGTVGALPTVAKYAPELAQKMQSVRGIDAVAPKLATAIESGGFNVGAPATTFTGKAANAALRVGGGATTGGVAAGMIDPNQAGTGATVGGAVSTILPVVGGAVSKVVQKLKPSQQIDPAMLAKTAVQQVADDLGVPVATLPQDIVNLVQNETQKAIKQGGTIDAAALLRKKEFESLGMTPLRGQMTRDPNQFAQELNLRGTSPEIAGRLQDQNRVLQGVFGNPAAKAVEQYQAGNELSSVLRNYDTTKRNAVSDLYKAARESAGKDLEVPLQGMAQDVAEVLDNFGDKVPSGVVNQLKKYGLLGEKQTKLFTVEEADKLMKVINANASNEPATNAALSRLRDSVRKSIETVDAEGGVFAPAVAAAKQRFSELDAIPALKAVANGDAVPDTFVKKFVVQGKTDEVKRLANLLRKESPESFEQAKAQMADDIKRAAFGENVTADSAVRPEMLAKKLREIGTDKMSAFFSPEEVQQYQTAMRVASYIAKHPNAAPVNTSNTLVAQLMTNPALNMAANAKGLGTVMAAGKAVSGAVKNQKAIATATNTNVPITKLDLDEAQRRLLNKAMGAIGASTSAVLTQ